MKELHKRDITASAGVRTVSQGKFVLRVARDGAWSVVFGASTIFAAAFACAPHAFFLPSLCFVSTVAH